MKLAEPSAHIAIDDRGRPCIAGTRIRVSQIAIDHLHWKWSAEAIVAQYPHLTLSQVHAALAYYFDHRKEIDAEIDAANRKIETTVAETSESSLARKARQAKLNAND